MSTLSYSTQRALNNGVLYVCNNWIYLNESVCRSQVRYEIRYVLCREKLWVIWVKLSYPGLLVIHALFLRDTPWVHNGCFLDAKWTLLSSLLMRLSFILLFWRGLCLWRKERGRCFEEKKGTIVSKNFPVGCMHSPHSTTSKQSLSTLKKCNEHSL